MNKIQQNKIINNSFETLVRNISILTLKHIGYSNVQTAKTIDQIFGLKMTPRRVSQIVSLEDVKGGVEKK